MPQKRNPVALEHARAIGSKAFGEAVAILTTVHNTPFGDIVDTEDDLQPLVYAMFRDATRAMTLVGAALAGAEFDAAKLEARAREGWITVTELADTLTRDHGLPFRTSHAITSRIVADLRGGQTGMAAALARAATAVIGRTLPYDEAALARILSPQHFVAVRTTRGGPAPEETARAIGAARETLAADRAWVEARTGALEAAAAELGRQAAAL